MLLFITFLFQAIKSKSDKEDDIKGTPDKGVLFFSTFDGKASFEPDGWQISNLWNYTGVWKVQTPPAPRSDTFEKMLVLTSKGIYSGISTILPKPVFVRGKPFIIQFEVRAFNNFTCSGAYIKLFDDEKFDPKKLSNETKQFLMFGPDFCGDKQNVEFRFFHKNPKTSQKVEKRLIDSPVPQKNDLNHLYTLIVRPDGTFSILIDNKNVKTAKFLGEKEETFSPPIIPPKIIIDTSVTKPDEWDDREYIADDSIKQPDFENEPELIPDKQNLNPPKGYLVDQPRYIVDSTFVGKEPLNWDTELLGVWEPPIIENPRCINSVGCGKYYPPLIANPRYISNWEQPMKKNPNYKGKWIPPKIENPEYFVDKTPFEFPKIFAIGFELLSTDGQIGFNNILIADDEKELIKWNNKFWESRKKRQLDAVPKPQPRKYKTNNNIVKVNFFLASWELFKEKWYYLLYFDPIPTLLLTIGGIILIILMFCFCINKIFPTEYEDEEGSENSGEIEKEDEIGSENENENESE
ncbi:Calnexin like protein [Tritrichomonas foetus]|uniref:Calnexin like protein n=1 Tax=Tritrichomonas foetus TaxID=1144522 RepID=A0A1J4KNA8_9EUKA|nr:Calnexin like protein [Tritrichomonas foetus]|eukprot:OHT10877.1 Calnexin like protein [Tritrichomonas foetus]